MNCWSLRWLCLSLSLISPGMLQAFDLAGLGALSGSAKHLLFHTEDSRDEPVTSALNRLRLELQGRYRSLAWHLVYDHEALVGDLVRRPDLALFQTVRSPTYLDVDDTISRGRDYLWRHRLHRATLHWEHPYGDVILGRQRLAWGSGRLWNPTDRFNPVHPTAIERTEKTGVDALLLTFKRGPFGALQLIGAPGKTSRGVGDKVAGRWRDTIGATDYAVLAGWLDQERVFGGELAANLWQGTVRLEVLHARPDEARSYTQAVAGYDYTLTNALFPDGLALLVEYFYNGAAQDFRLPVTRTTPTGLPTLPQVGSLPPSSLRLTSTNRIESRTPHQLGFSAGYDLTPLWRVDGLAIVDLEQGSYFVAPRLAWSATASLTLTVGAHLFGGVAGSEFGSRAHLYLAQLELFF